MGDLTALISAANKDDDHARARLFSLAYAELKSLARAKLYSGRPARLDTTALVHESYLRLSAAGPLRLRDRAAFFAYSAKVMRSVIVDMARSNAAGRRGGGIADATLSPELEEVDATSEREILAVHDALLALEEVAPRLAQVVELRYFGGFTETEIASHLGMTLRTVSRDWEKARLLLIEFLAS